ncbi:uncharacterized protein IL334_003881 [Kwoniella shivajii]|uniref:Zn(2)-C6 fungal-type domain-containing protein n=1 Tax=Kwoniella shivajii TaxID=564305 RepID=A0ABZ1CZ74_9TREE|nr:hypothetical protein IL334_003881 [Kwoniella shivajii]
MADSPSSQIPAEAGSSINVDNPIKPSHLSPSAVNSAPIQNQAESSAQAQSQEQSAPTAYTPVSSEVVPQFAPYVPNANGNGRRSSTGPGAVKSVNGQHRSVGPELSTPSKLAQASGGSFVPTGEPPYIPPPDIVYPPERIPNPFWGDMSPQPIIENFPANTLYRPQYLPSDIDDRLDKRSVWIGVEKDSARAVYFLPPTCQCCKNPAVAQHCDRGWPKCARCISRGVTCIPGKAWGMMRPKGKRRNLKAEASKPKTIANKVSSTARARPPAPTTASTLGAGGFSSAEKGKGKATELPYVAPPQLPALPNEARYPSTSLETQIPFDEISSTRKRRLSSAAEADTKRTRRKSNRDSIGPLPSSSNLPMTLMDQAYFSRLEVNARRPPLSDMNGPCPVWAKSRRALQVAAEYLREPKKTAGASVEIGVGGIARGVILEGKVIGAQGVFWGKGREAGTIVTAIGHPRRQQFVRHLMTDDSREASPQPTEHSTEPFPRSSTPPLNILSTVYRVKSFALSAVNASERFWAESKPVSLEPTPNESPEVAALLMAQRARTPVALAIAQDYDAVPFKVPRPLIVLGWFWIADAWLEPVMPDLELFTLPQRAPSGPPERVIWKFRFEWCTGRNQDVPWWSSSLEPNRPVPNPFQPQQPIGDHEWTVSGPSHTGPTTVSPPSREEEMRCDRRVKHICENCHYISTRVYVYGDICLNEGCPWFFGDTSSVLNRIGPLSNRPAPLQPKARILPETLRLELRPAEPSGISHETTQADVGRDFWRGWVCKKCGLAQERYKWVGWCCEACGHSIQPPRRIYTAEDLRRPSRPVCVSSRQDDGYASFPYRVDRSWSLFDNNIKVIKHSLDSSLFGAGNEVHHVLAHEGNDVNKIAGAIFKGLQSQAENELPLRRFAISPTSRKPVDIFLSPFYTYLCGSDSTPLPAFPTNRSIHWQNVPPICLEAIDLINERAGKMFSEQSEFGSLLIAANPPNLPNSLTPKLVVESHAYMALLFLGSDGTIRVKPYSGKGKQGEITVQHGDVIGIKGGEEGIEVSMKMDNFGFFCIARHNRPAELLPPQTATSDSRFSSDSFPLHLRSDSHPSSSIEPLSATFATFQETFQNSSSNDHQTSPQAVFEAASQHHNTPLFGPKKSRPRASVVPPPPKNVKPDEMPLDDWYIGGYPLSDNQPLRVFPPYRPRPPSKEDDDQTDKDKKSMIFLDEMPSYNQIDPPPLSPLPGYDDLEPEPPVPVPIPAVQSQNKKATPSNKRAKPTPISTPTTSGRKKGPRASLSATPVGSVIDPEEGTPSVKSSGTTSARGGKKPRAKGRKSLV